MLSMPNQILSMLLAERGALPPTFITLLICLVFFYFGGKGLLTGKVSTRGGQYDRTESPLAYWFFTLMFLAAGIGTAVLVIMRR